MTASDLLDFERLLTPIPGGNPCGDALRWDPLWDEIRSARAQRNDVVDETEDSAADWLRVYELATGALYTRTKDLMIAGWLVESLVHLHGIAGLRDGLRGIRELVETFWENLYPEIGEDGDLEVRAAPFVWLTDRDGGARLHPLLRAEVPLARADDDGQVFSWSYANSRLIPPRGEQESDDAYVRRKAEADEKKSRLDAAVSATPREFYLELYRELDECKTELSKVEAAVDERLGEAAPGWSALRQAVEDLEMFVKRVLNEKGGIPGPPSAEGAPVETNGAERAVQNEVRHAVGAGGPIRSRAEAIASLKACAEYLRQNEPHSLVASLVQRAVNWAEMPLERVLADLVKDDQTLAQISDMLGIRKTTSDD